MFIFKKTGSTNALLFVGKTINHTIVQTVVTVAFERQFI